MNRAVIIFAAVLGLVSFCTSSVDASNKKVLYVDSYHKEYKPGMIMHKAVIDILEPAGVEVKFVYMDAKRKKSDDTLRQAALRVKSVIESWKPDVVIAADDVANKYLVKPYFKDADLPFVFIGVNWEVQQYGYPYKNVTGQIEVELVEELITELKRYSSGKRVGFLAGKTLTDQKALKYYRDVLNLQFHRVELVENFDDWLSSYKSLQNEVDVLLFRNNSGIKGWNDSEAQKQITKHTLIPTGTVSTHLYRLVLISYSKLNHEFGEYGARTALQILDGKPPGQIPISRNKQAKVYLNMKLAKKMGIKFPMDRLKDAHMVSAVQKKLLFVNSYHKGYQWSDDIEKGLLKALNITEKKDGNYDTLLSEVEIRFFRMDTKRNKSEAHKKQIALSVKELIDEWQPDVVVTSDDNAAKYLIAPYYKNSEIPFVFCALNWDATAYGLPVANVTGMVEISPILETIELMKMYAKGDRLGFMGVESLSAQKEIANYTKSLGVKFADVKLVSTFDEWQDEYLRLQDSVDMILWTNPIGIKGWDSNLATDFILANTKIPTGGTSDSNMRFALLGRVKIAEEQGWWAGKTALRILKGTSPSDIPVTTNKESRLYLNMELAKRLRIKFPMELIENATFLDNQKRD